MEAGGCIHVFQHTYSPILDRDEVGRFWGQGWNEEMKAKSDVIFLN